MRPHAERHYTVEEYLAIEESSAVRHEFYDGEIFAMAGASLRHNRIAGNIYATLRARLEGSACEVFASDLRGRTPGGLYTYPDVLVVCGGVELSADDRLDTVLNPTVIVEVLSESTRDYDRSKFALYRALLTLREYVLVEQESVLVELFTNPLCFSPSAGGRAEWARREYGDLQERLSLCSLGVELSLAEIYANVEAGGAAR
jgi:Uma2 family endonuclease